MRKPKLSFIIKHCLSKIYARGLQRRKKVTAVELCGNGLTNKVLRLLWLAKVIDKFIPDVLKVLRDIDEGAIGQERPVKEPENRTIKVKNRRSSLRGVRYVVCDGKREYN